MRAKYKFLIGILLGCLAYGCVQGETVPCALREMEYGLVCICNATYCDFLDDPTPTKDNEFVIVSSSKAGLRFAITSGEFGVDTNVVINDYENTEEDEENNDISEFQNEDFSRVVRNAQLKIDREQTYQEITGFGGSFTGAVSYLMEALPEQLQNYIYESFYADHGIGFNLMRIPIGGCDFDLSPWAYNEIPENDENLSNFTIDPRDELRFAQIKQLIEVSKVQNLRIKGAAWSAPPWMKSNNKWTGFSHLKKEYYQTWANYHLKWLELMEENGLPVWAISTGNEPLNGVLFMYFVKFMSLGWTPKNQAVWLADHLGPTIRNSKYKDIIIFSNDDQSYSYPKWFHIMNETRENVLDYIDGMAVHWYWDEIVSLNLMDKARAEWPEKLLLATESCIGDKPWQKAVPTIGSWERGEKYARAYLQNLQHGYNGWIDWNIILDEEGGPNYVDNTVDAPTIVNMTNPTEVFKQPIFYAIGHYSKFIAEGSVRIDAIRSNVNVDSVAFLRPDGFVVAVIFNSGRAAVEVSFADSISGDVILHIPAKSIHTLIYK